ncbi:MAG: family N-acetyltransferase [Ferruginibacter sp.]|nr:family N-acetyltransferase [Ferruginibacter sp.]
MVIQYFSYQQINKQKWDDCISNAGNGLIYGYSVYLDTMAYCWDALVLNDYEVVMPLTWNKKFGIYYLYQPFCTAALGLFGNNITAGMVNDFLEAIPAKFKYWDIYLNHKNLFHLKDFELYERSNYTLALNAPYEKLFAGFGTNLKQSIKKSEQLNCSVRKNIDVKEVIALAKEQSKRFSPATGEDYRRFEALYRKLHAQEKAITYGVYSSSNQLLASCILFFSHNRMYYILAGNHPKGKPAGASHALINAFIKAHAEQDILLDFEGSDVPSLAFFYSRFGSTIEKYPGMKRNRLPAIVKLFKK